MYKDKKNRPYFILLIGLFSGTFGATSLTPPSNFLSYGCFAAILGLFLYRRLFGNDKPIRKLRFSGGNLFPLLLVGVWLYGLALGVYYGNNNVLRNFAGMTVYLLFYIFLIERLNKFDLLRSLIIAAGINTCYMFIFFVWDKAFSRHFYDTIAFSFLSTRAYYSESMVLLAVPMMLLMHKLFSMRTNRNGMDEMSDNAWVAVLNKRDLLVLTTYAFALNQISLSKAAVAFYITALCGFFLLFIRNVVLFVRNRCVAPLLIIVMLFALSFYPAILTLGSYLPDVFTVTALKDWVTRTDSSHADEEWRAQLDFQQETQKIRRRQSNELMKELSLWGHGLGATLASGYKRDTAGYSFESNYLNLAHKFGVFSGLIFAFYIYLILKILSGFRHIRTRRFSLGGISILMCMVMGFGNPILMSPVVVAFQCVILYWLQNESFRSPPSHEKN